MKFLDQAKIFIQSGTGGDGCVSFRREKHQPRGGPDGGNGGRGGDVYAKAAHNLNTLIDFRYRQHFCAKNGHHGRGKHQTGISGPPLTFLVPVGTAIFMEDRQTLIADMVDAEQNVLLAKGADGGQGNSHFKSSTNQASRRADPGWPGVGFWIWLRLKLIADVALIGLPNAGKSTLLRALTQARPHVASYPFTTMHPHLGVLLRHGKSIVMADLPGLIKGAHLGVGLGHRFLGHTERCRCFLHVVDGCSYDVVQEVQTVQEELRAYGSGLEGKTHMILLNKIDALTPSEQREKLQALRQNFLCPVHPISAACAQGLDAVVHAL